MRRREFTAIISGLAMAAWPNKSFAQRSFEASRPADPAATLLTAPIELAGDWGGMFPRSVARVIERARQACLGGVPLISDRQPRHLRVERRGGGFPAVWLHSDGNGLAWIVVNVGERDWSKLAYQVGHELGHVMANSWQADAKPGGPSQWLEEALAEALSLYGLGRLANSWKENPPFAGDSLFGDAIAEYRAIILRQYTLLADQQGLARDPAAWFADHRADIEVSSVAPYGQALSLNILAEYDRSTDCIAAIGALNRWPGRAGIPLIEYLRLWELSCTELGASTRLPIILRKLLLKS